MINYSEEMLQRQGTLRADFDPGVPELRRHKSFSQWIFDARGACRARTCLHGRSLTMRLKNVLQGELQDPWITCSSDLSESVVVEHHDGFCAPGRETVRHVENVHASFEFPAFADLETPGQRHVELPGARTGETPWRHISVAAQWRQREGDWIQVIVYR